MEFWNNFLELCNNVGKSPNAVAKEIGVSSATITAWKLKPERVPQDRMLLKISEYFDVPTEQLLSRNASKPGDLGAQIHNKGGFLKQRPKRTIQPIYIVKKENAPGETILTESENMLLELFRQLPPDKQELVAQTVKAFADSQK